MNEEVVMEAQTDVVEQPQQQTKQELNFVALRLKLEKEEEARKNAERRAEEAERRAREYQTAQPVPLHKVVTDDDDADLGSINPDDYIQGHQYKQSSKRFNSKQREHDEAIAALNQKINMLETLSTTSKLQDFEQVVNTDNLKLLERLYPDEYELMRTSTASLSTKSKAAYNILKNYGVIENSVQEVARKIEDNKRKPLSAGTASAQQSPTPLSKYNDDGRRIMTEAERDRINKEVQRKLSTSMIK